MIRSRNAPTGPDHSSCRCLVRSPLVLKGPEKFPVSVRLSSEHRDSRAKEGSRSASLVRPSTNGDFWSTAIFRSARGESASASDIHSRPPSSGLVENPCLCRLLPWLVIACSARRGTDAHFARLILVRPLADSREDSSLRSTRH